MSILFRGLVFAIAVLLAGCATQEYRRVQAECAPEALRDYPAQRVHGVATRERMMPIYMGRTCSVSPGGGTICHDIVQPHWVAYQESVVVDLNEAVRNSAIQSCAQHLCLQRYGNAECKTDVRLVPVGPAVEVPTPQPLPVAPAPAPAR